MFALIITINCRPKPLQVNTENIIKLLPENIFSFTVFNNINEIISYSMLPNYISKLFPLNPKTELFLNYLSKLDYKKLMELKNFGIANDSPIIIAIDNYPPPTMYFLFFYEDKNQIDSVINDLFALNGISVSPINTKILNQYVTLWKYFDSTLLLEYFNRNILVLQFPINPATPIEVSASKILVLKETITQKHSPKEGNTVSNNEKSFIDDKSFPIFKKQILTSDIVNYTNFASLPSQSPNFSSVPIINFLNKTFLSIDLNRENISIDLNTKIGEQVKVSSENLFLKMFKYIDSEPYSIFYLSQSMLDNINEINSKTFIKDSIIYEIHKVEDELLKNYLSYILQNNKPLLAYSNRKKNNDTKSDIILVCLFENRLIAQEIFNELTRIIKVKKYSTFWGKDIISIDYKDFTTSLVLNDNTCTLILSSDKQRCQNYIKNYGKTNFQPSSYNINNNTLLYLNFAEKELMKNILPDKFPNTFAQINLFELRLESKNGYLNINILIKTEIEKLLQYFYQEICTQR